MDAANQVDGSMRDLARLALGPDWPKVAPAVGTLDAPSLAETIAAYEDSMRALGEIEPIERQSAGRWDAQTANVRAALKPIGMKISPTLSTEQCAAWLTSMVMALSDFPAKIIVQASRSAIRVPISFLSDVDRHVRAEAEQAMARHRMAIRRLRALQREIEAASQPKLEAPEGWESGQSAALSQEELRRTPKSVLRMGLAAGHISEADLRSAGVSAADDDMPAGSTIQ